jgi:hypothetical protein
MAETAPRILQYPLLRGEQPGSDRVQVHIVTGCSQVAGAAAVDDNGFVPAAKDMPEKLEADGALYLKIKQRCRRGPQRARPLANLRNRDFFGNLHNGIADFFHHAANRATRFIRAGTFLVEALADATDRRQGAFDVAHHTRQRDVMGRFRQAIPSGNASFALDQAGGFQIGENLFEETLRNILLGRDRAD